MRTELTPNRHGILFEMLRHQTLSDVTTKRVQTKDLARESEIDADAFQKQALQSWGKVKPAALPRKPLPAKPGRNYEFFRAVRA